MRYYRAAMVSEIGQIAGFLRDTVPFSLLDPNTIAKLSRQIEVRYARKDDTLLEAGTQNDQLFLVRSGAVELRLAGEELTARIGTGSCFAYPSLLRGGEVRNTTKALEDTLLYCLPAETFHQLREDSEAFRDFFLADETERLRLAVQKRQAGAHNALQNTPLGELIGRTEPVHAAPDMSISDAAKLMQAKDVSTLAICADDSLIGIFTDKDLRNRVVADGASLDAPVSSVMTAGPQTLPTSATASQAIAMMARGGFRHIPLLADTGKLAGILSATDVLAHLGNNAVDHGLAIARANNVTDLVAAAQRIPEGFVAMVRSGLHAAQVTQFVSALGEATHRRAAELVEEELGQPPCKYALIAFGSLARREQLVGSDQDNGLVLEDSVDGGGRAYFERFGTRLSDILNDAGFRYCDGGIMAKNAEQRLTQKEWLERFRKWIASPDEDSILRATIYFDMRGICGATDLVRSLRKTIVAETAGSSIFLSYLARDALRSTIPLGFFKNFVLEKGSDGEKVFNAKAQAVIPAVDIARALSLAHDIAEVGTVARLEALEAKGAMAATDARSLIDALDFVNELRIQHQAAQVAKGIRPDHAIAPEALSHLEREHLKDAFSVIRSQLDSLRRNHAGGVA